MSVEEWSMESMEGANACHL